MKSFQYCPNTTNILERSEKRELLNTYDILRKSVKIKPNRFLFYFYNDGSVEKKLLVK